MAIFKETTQPQEGVYGWYVRLKGQEIAIYIGKAGARGTLRRGVDELLRTPFCTTGFGSLDTDFIVGTAIMYLEKEGWHCVWQHLCDRPHRDFEYIKNERPFLQRGFNSGLRGAPDYIKDEYRLKKGIFKGHWKGKQREAETKLFSVLKKEIAKDSRF
jgi:hypothetical protein